MPALLRALVLLFAAFLALAPVVRAQEPTVPPFGIVGSQSSVLRFTTPDGHTIAVDVRLVPALTTLGTLDTGATLVNALGRGGVRLEIANLDGWGQYQSSERLVRIDASLLSADARVLATLLAREASHAQSDIDGLAAHEAQAPDPRQACAADDVRAAERELEVWSRFFGAEGKQPTANAYEVHVNDQLAAYVAAPYAFRASGAGDLAGRCTNWSG